ncbi:SGNH/GDSL hydrolase family protein [Candidatus Pelagibacter sp. Uisw_092]|uniref:SGNH/GDSL hydrolase family protein n=1 Tax=Candidatus Pelagibacter sp. Uisw_092 TaxID=3230979 RepID=UPI0039E7559B
MSVIFLDIIFSNLTKKKTIQVYDKELGWIIDKSVRLNLESYTKQKKKYKIEYFTSEVKGFREFDKKEIKRRNILIIGDSYTTGPFASNTKMYYSQLKKKLEERDLYFNWFVGGGGGYGTLQQYLLIKKNLNEIKPDIFIHQFCENDFENNTKIIEKNSILRSQYYFRPYLENDEIIYDTTIIGKVYKFFYHKSYLFKKIDKIVSSYQYGKNGYFDKKIYEENIDSSIDSTSKIIDMIKNLIGNDVLYVSINCTSKNDAKFQQWQNILRKYNIVALTEPNKFLKILSKNNEDIYYADGAHLNEYGNKIFGEKIYEELVKILINNKKLN